MEFRKITVDSTRLIGELIIAGIFIVWLYLMALNGRYMYANMEGDDLLIDKWTKSIYVNRGDSKLKKVEEKRYNYNLPPLY